MPTNCGVLAIKVDFLDCPVYFEVLSFLYDTGFKKISSFKAQNKISLFW